MFENWSGFLPDKEVFIWLLGGVRKIQWKMRNFQNEKIVTMEMEKNWRGEEKGISEKHRWLCVTVWTSKMPI